MFALVGALLALLQPAAAYNSWGVSAPVSIVALEERSDLLVQVAAISNSLYDYSPPAPPAWQLVLSQRPEIVGLTAGAFLSQDKSSIVVAFRGEANASQPNAAGDECAALLLFGNTTYSQLPRFCTARFDQRSLDYYTQALHFVAGAQGRYGDASLLLTGFGMGGALAQLVSLTALSTVPVVSFAAPGIQQAMLQRQLPRAVVQEAQLWLLSIQGDPVVVSTASDTVGSSCSLPALARSAGVADACHSCAASKWQDMSCQSCLLATHNRTALAALLHTASALKAAHCSLHPWPRRSASLVPTIGWAVIAVLTALLAAVPLAQPTLSRCTSRRPVGTASAAAAASSLPSQPSRVAAAGDSFSLASSAALTVGSGSSVGAGVAAVSGGGVGGSGGGSGSSGGPAGSRRRRKSVRLNAADERARYHRLPPGTSVTSALLAADASDYH